MADFNIKLDLETKEAQQNIKEIEKAWVKTKQQIIETEAEVKRLSVELDSVVKKYEEVAKAFKVPKEQFFGTNDFREANKRLDEAKNKLNELNEKAIELQKNLLKALNPPKTGLVQAQPSKLFSKESIKENAEETANEFIEATARVISSKEIPIKKLNIEKGIAASLSKIPEITKNVFSGLDRIERHLTTTFNTLKPVFEGISNMAQRAFSKIGEQIKKPFAGIKNGFNSIQDSISSTISRIGKLAAYTFIFNIINKGFRDIRDLMSDFMSTSSAFSASIAQIRGNLLTAFQPIWETILPYLIKFVQWLANATAYVSAFISGLFGKTEQSSRDSAKQMQAQIQASKEASKALNKQKKDTDKLAKSTDKTNKVLAKFDELNVLSKKKKNKGNNAGVGDTGAVPSNISFATPKIDTSSIEQYANKVKEFLSPVFEAFEKLYPQLERLGSYTLDAFGDFYNTFLKPLSSYVVNDAIPHLLNSMADSIARMDFKKLNEGLHNLFEALEPITEQLIAGLLSFYDNFLAPLSEYVVNKFLVDFFNNTAEALKKMDFSKVISGLGELFKNVEKFTEHALSGLNWLWKNILLPMAGYAVNTAIPKFLNAVNKGLSTTNTLIEKLKPYLEELKTEYLEPIGDILKNTINVCLEELNDLMDDFKDQVNDSDSELNKLLPHIKDFVGELLELGAMKLSNDIKIAFYTFTWGIRLLVSVIAGAFKIVKSFIDILYGLAKWDITKMSLGVLNLNRALGGKDLYNSAEDAANDFVNRFRGRVPYLAQGAVIPPNSPFLAMLGDQRRGTNIEAPLDTIKQAFIEALNENGNYNNKGSYTFVAQIDGRTIFEETVRQNDMYMNQAGRSAFAY